MSVTEAPSTLLHPGDAGYDEARATFNLAVDQRPAAVVVATSPEDVVAAVAFARDRGLRVAPQTSGHNAGPLGSLDQAVLVKTAMVGVEVDVEARTARVLAGTRWRDVTPHLEGTGLAALHGSSPDVGVVGYSLGGGLGWLARKHGLQAQSVTAVELVTADGEQVRADAEQNAELLWALRGGGGNFGVVTAIEFRLYPVEELYAGWLIFPWERTAEVLTTWNALLPDWPDEITSLGRVLQLPPLPELPEPLRGAQIVVIEAAFLGSVADGEALLAPLRALGPVMDTFAAAPTSVLGELHQDPRDPMPASSAHVMTGDLPTEGIEAFAALTGAGSGSPFVAAELRHLGGALARHDAEAGALPGLNGTFAMFAVGVPFDADSAQALAAHGERIVSALKPYGTGAYLNFAERPTDTSTAYTPAAYERLQAIRASWDPSGVVLANHRIQESNR